MKFNIITKNWLKRLKEKILGILAEDFLKDSPVRILLFWSVVLSAVTWLVALLSFAPSSYQVPVKYNSFMGVTELGNWYELYRVPLALLACLFLNIVLASFLYRKDKMVSYIILGSLIFLSIASLIVTINLRMMLGNS